MIARHMESTKPTLIDALKDRRMTAILLLSFASGLPFNLTGSTLQAWLASVDIDIKTIGIFSLLTAPYVLKFLWAPLLDRFLPPLLGRRRGWIMLFQLALGVSLAVMGLTSPREELAVLGTMAFLVAFLSASQDIVFDAYRVDVIPPAERGLAAAATNFGYRSAAMFGGAVLLMVAKRVGFRSAYELVAGIMLLTVLATFWAPEPEVPGRPPRTITEAVVEPLTNLLAQPAAVGFLLFVLLYKVGDAFALSLYSAFMLKGMHFTLDQLSWGKVDMTVSTMAGAAVGGWLYMRWGMFRALIVFGVAQACTNLLYMWLALAGSKFWLMLLATGLDTGVGGMGQAAFIGFIVSLCSASYSATQFALLSALAAVPRTVLGWVAATVVSSVGWAQFFVITFATAVPGLTLLVLLRSRIDALEARAARP
jgi:PAT family beta-lactamase induction signal transducer AmpG